MDKDAQFGIVELSPARCAISGLPVSSALVISAPRPVIPVRPGLLVNPPRSSDVGLICALHQRQQAIALGPMTAHEVVGFQTSTTQASRHPQISCALCRANAHPLGGLAGPATSFNDPLLLRARIGRGTADMGASVYGCSGCRRNSLVLAPATFPTATWRLHDRRCTGPRSGHVRPAAKGRSGRAALSLRLRPESELAPTHQVRTGLIMNNARRRDSRQAPWRSQCAGAG